MTTPQNKSTTPKGNFLGLLCKMPTIKRWALTECIVPENIAEHSHQVAVLSHLLAIILNKKFNGNVNPEACATLALYHDMSETICTDFPSPLKYWQKDMTALFKKLEHQAEVGIHASLVDSELMDELRHVIIAQHNEPAAKAIVKSADTIAAYLKARYEFKYRQNHEFKEAFKNTRELLNQRRKEYPEVQWFYDFFVENMSVSIDDILKMKINHSEESPQDFNGESILVGDTVICLDDDTGSDSDENFDIKKGKTYVVEKLHDEDGLMEPMIVLAENDSGPLFGNRFAKVTR